MQRDGRSLIRLPDGTPHKDSTSESNFEYIANYKKRQQLISFGHEQWGFKNWSWSVTKQELDFVDYANGKYCAGVVAFVSVTVTSLGLRREDIGYATTVSLQKGSAVYKARKVSVTNALRETLLGFGGKLATQLMEQLDMFKVDKTEDLANENETVTNAGDALVQKRGNSQRKDFNDGSESSVVIKSVRSPQRHNSHQRVVKNALPQPVDVPNIPANQTIGVNPNGFVANHNGKIVQSVSPQVPQMAPGSARPIPGSTPVSAPNPNVHQPETVVPEADKIDEEMRAERIRRQKQKMEEFKIKQMQKNGNAPLG